MLAITLDPRQHIDTYPASQSDDWHFQVKVVNEGLFAEVRVCFLPADENKKNQKKMIREHSLNKGNTQE